MVGEQLAGRYELEELIGAGGMSRVYRAHDRDLDRTVAVKVLHEEMAADLEFVSRFRREARTAAGLAHENIVAVIDRGSDGDRPFIVFEYFGRKNLKQLIQEVGPLPLEQALGVALQIAHGLSFAHASGYVHRDVKPQNVLVDGTRVKLTDFGIARSLEVTDAPTLEGVVLGSVSYIAPEQAQGDVVGEQSDVYALGAVLYELLTGEPPFDGETFVAVAMKHITDPPPSVRARRPEIPPRVDAAIRKALAKKPAWRFASMDAFARELGACLRGEPMRDNTAIFEPIVVPRPPSARTRSRAGRWAATAGPYS